MYLKGEGVKKDYKEAFKYFKLSALQDHVLAQYSLGTMYYKGYGIPSNDFEAYKWWMKAAKQGSKDSQIIKNIILIESFGKPIIK